MSRTPRKRQRSVLRLALVVIVAHLLAGAAHGYVHEAATVPLRAWQHAFVWIVATAGPIAAGVLLWRGSIRTGSLLLVATMAAATVFGVTFHGIVDNPDHVSSVSEPWRTAFLLTAIGVTVTDLAGVLVGAWCYLERNTS